MISKNDVNLAFWTALFLFGLYISTFDGTLHSTDGLSMFAVGENLLKHLHFDTRQLENWENVTLGLDGRPYTVFPIGPTLWMLPLLALARLWPGLGLIQTTMLLMPLSSAFSAVYLYLIARRLGYNPTVSLVTTLLAGLATMTWPRTRDLVADPLILLGFNAAFYYALAYRQDKKLYQVWLMGLVLSLTVLNKVVNAVTAPFFLWYVAVPGFNIFQFKKFDWRAGFIVALPVILAILTVGGYNSIRFGDPLDSGFRGSIRFSTPPWIGFIGVLISPYRSLFLYIPLFLLLPFSLKKMGQRHSRELGLILALLVSHMLVFGGWHDWGGGKSWGPRYLAALNGLLILLLLPLIEQAGRPAHRLRRVALMGMSVVSLGVQILGISARDDPWLGAARYWIPPPNLSFWGDLSWDKPQQWPIWGHLLAFDPAAIPVIWRWQWHKINHFDSFSLLLVLLIAGMGLAGLWLVYRGKAGGGWKAVAGWLAALGCAGLILTRSYGDPRSIERPQEADEVWPGYEQLMAQLPQLVQADEAVIFTDRRFELYLLDTDKSAAQRYLLAKPTQPQILETVPKLLQQDRPRRVWLVTDKLDNRLLAYAVELWLRERARPAAHYLFGESVQLVGFEASSNTRWEAIPPEPRLAGLVEPADYTFKGFGSLLGWRWPGFDLKQSPALQPGQSYPFELYWIYRGKAPQDVFFVRLVDQAGRVVCQTSTTPRPGSRLIPGQLLVEDAVLAVPAGLASGRYQLQLGFKTPAVAAGELVFELPVHLSTVEVD